MMCPKTKAEGRKRAVQRLTFVLCRSAFGPGFTVPELLLTFAILFILAAITMSGFSRFRASAALDQSVEEAIGLLREARSRSLGSRGAPAWGVHFDTNSLTLYPAAYVAGAAANQAVDLPGVIEITAIQLATTTGNVLFERLSGETSATGTVSFTASSGRTKSIRILPSGLSRVE